MRKILILGIVAAAVISASVFYFENDKKKLRELSVGGELMTRFKSVDSKSDIQMKSSSFRWNDGEGYSILVPATESFFVVKPEKGCLNHDLAVDIFSKEISAAEKVFAERGFVLDIANSSVDASDDRFYDYIQAYKKDGELCVMAVNPDCISYQRDGVAMTHQLSVSCGTASVFKEARVEQIPFLDILELKNTNSVVRVKNQSGDFFQIGVGGLRGGTTAVLKKENNSYRALFVGQEAPYCSLIKKERIPREVLSSIGGGSCFTDSGEYIMVE